MRQTKATGICGFFGSLLFLLGSTLPAHSAVVYLGSSATGAENGTSWTDAYTELYPALAAADSSDEVWVAAGTYTPEKIDRSTTFALNNGVAVCGGLAGA